MSSLEGDCCGGGEEGHPPEEMTEGGGCEDLGSRLEEELNRSIEKMREEEQQQEEELSSLSPVAKDHDVPLAKLISLSDSVTGSESPSVSSSSQCSTKSPHSPQQELLQDVQMPACIISTLNDSPTDTKKRGCEDLGSRLEEELNRSIEKMREEQEQQQQEEGLSSVSPVGKDPDVPLARLISLSDSVTGSESPSVSSSSQGSTKSPHSPQQELLQDVQMPTCNISTLSDSPTNTSQASRSSREHSEGNKSPHDSPIVQDVGLTTSNNSGPEGTTIPITANEVNAGEESPKSHTHTPPRLDTAVLAVTTSSDSNDITRESLNESVFHKSDDTGSPLSTTELLQDIDMPTFSLSSCEPSNSLSINNNGGSDHQPTQTNGDVCLKASDVQVEVNPLVCTFSPIKRNPKDPLLRPVSPSTNSPLGVDKASDTLSSSCILSEALSVVSEIERAADPNLTSSPHSPDRRMTVHPLDLEDINDSLLSSLPRSVPLPSLITEGDVASCPPQAVISKKENTMDRMKKLLGITGDHSVLSVDNGLAGMGSNGADGANTTYACNTVAEREQCITGAVNTTFEINTQAGKTQGAGVNTTFDCNTPSPTAAAADTTFNMVKESKCPAANTTFGIGDKAAVNTTFTAAPNTDEQVDKPELNVTFEKGEYRIGSQKDTVNLMDAEENILQVILDSTPKKASKQPLKVTSTPKISGPHHHHHHPYLKAGLIRTSPKNFLNRLTDGVAKEGEHQEPSLPTTTMGSKVMDSGNYRPQRQLWTRPGPLKALPLSRVVTNTAHLEANTGGDSSSGGSNAGNNTRGSLIQRRRRINVPSYGSISSIDSEMPGTPVCGINPNTSISSPEAFREDVLARGGPCITSTPTLTNREGVFSAMMEIDGAIPTPISQGSSKPYFSQISSSSLPEQVASEDKRPVGNEDEKEVKIEDNGPVESEDKREVEIENKSPTESEDKRVVVNEDKGTVGNEDKGEVKIEDKGPVANEENKVVIEGSGPVANEDKREVVSENKSPVLSEDKRPVTSKDNEAKSQPASLSSPPPAHTTTTTTMETQPPPPPQPLQPSTTLMNKENIKRNKQQKSALVSPKSKRSSMPSVVPKRSVEVKRQSLLARPNSQRLTQTHPLQQTFGKENRTNTTGSKLANTLNRPSEKPTLKTTPAYPKKLLSPSKTQADVENRRNTTGSKLAITLNRSSEKSLASLKTVPANPKKLLSPDKTQADVENITSASGSKLPNSSNRSSEKSIVSLKTVPGNPKKLLSPGKTQTDVKNRTNTTRSKLPNSLNRLSDKPLTSLKTVPPYPKKLLSPGKTQADVENRTNATGSELANTLNKSSDKPVTSLKTVPPYPKKLLSPGHIQADVQNKSRPSSKPSVLPKIKPSLPMRNSLAVRQKPSLLKTPKPVL